MFLLGFTWLIFWSRLDCVIGFFEFLALSVLDKIIYQNDSQKQGFKTTPKPYKRPHKIRKMIRTFYPTILHPLIFYLCS